MGEKLRIRYEKTGSAVYISHLDLMSCMRRSLLRAGIALRYSSGFNPHPYISVALPLQVGTASLCELLDFEPEDMVIYSSQITASYATNDATSYASNYAANTPLNKIANSAANTAENYIANTAVNIAENHTQLTESLNRALPEGLKALEIYLPEMKFSTIAWVDIVGELNYNGAAEEHHISEKINEIADQLNDCFSGGALTITKKTKSGSSELDIVPYIKNVSISTVESVKLPAHGVPHRTVQGTTNKTVKETLLPTPQILQLPSQGTLRFSARVSAQNPSITPNDILSAMNMRGIPAPYNAVFTRTQLLDSDMCVFR